VRGAVFVKEYTVYLLYEKYCEQSESGDVAVWNAVIPVGSVMLSQRERLGN
jgi:hypothetical protein